MSVVEGYVLHLYCDHPKHAGRHSRMDEFSGDTRAGAWRTARKRGWRKLRQMAPVGAVIPNTPITFCPECARRLT